MSEAHSIPPEQSSNGVKGLAMMAPFIGVPVLFHALSGTVVTGLGFFTVASALTPFKDDLLKVAKSVAKEISTDLEKFVPSGSSSESLQTASSGESNDILVNNEDNSAIIPDAIGLRDKEPAKNEIYHAIDQDASIAV
jgi:hypothetical protein